MRKISLPMGAAIVLVAGGVASAQLAVLPGQDIPAPGSGYGAPYSPRNAPNIDQTADQTTGMSTKGVETTGQGEPTFEERWSAQSAVPYLPPDVAIPDPTTGAPSKNAPAEQDESSGRQ
jgi:hypothetical protein